MSEASVIVRVENGVGRLTLNRPQALHALTTEMCRIMTAALHDWADTSAVHRVVIDHADGTRGFCAGGDIRMVAESGRTDGRAGAAFFAVEYRLNAQIKRFAKPIIALMDGVTMGGGVGISVHGSHRIASENTIFAMPETGIGLFPDVGGGWFLPRLQGELGTWLALTGARLKGADVLAAGIATHFVSGEELPEFKKRVLAGEDVSPPPHAVAPPSYAPYLDLINGCFAGDTVSEILAALNDSGDTWAAQQSQVLMARSPLSMAVALAQLRRGRTMTAFQDVMRMEYRIACRIIRTSDFSEGVRAVIEDKDNAPRWLKASEVTTDLVDSMFAPVARELEFP